MLAKCTGNLWNCALEKFCLDTFVDGPVRAGGGSGSVGGRERLAKGLL